MKKLIGGLFVLGVTIMVGVGMGYAADGEVLSHQEIANTLGGLTETLASGDSFGAAVANIGDLDGDGIEDIAVGAYGDDDGGTNHGSVYILFMNADGTVASEQKISDTAGDFTATLDDFDHFGKSIVGLGDLNGDTVLDIAVGVTGDSDGASGGGAVYILFLNTNGTVSSYQKISDTEGNFTATLDTNDFFGASIANIGDLNDDGVSDIAVGAYADDDGGTDKGSLYILFMDTDGTLDSDGTNGSPVAGFQKISDIAGGFTATMGTSDRFGIAAAGIGDLDVDGVADIVVGASGDGGSFRGAAYILFMNVNGTVSSYQKITNSTGGFATTLENFDYFGAAVSSAGDINNDEVDDIIIGAFGDDDGGSTRGAVYILFMNADGTVASEQKISDTSGEFTATLDNSDSFGVSLSFMNDLGGDGIPDIVVGAFSNDGGDTTGAVYVLNMDGVAVVADTPSSPAPNLPTAFTLNIHGDSACTWDDSVYVALSGQNISRVILSDNPQFVGARVLPYTPGNGSTLFGDEEVTLPGSMYAQMTLPALSALDGLLYGDYTLYAASRGSSGNLGSIVSDTITLTPNTECNFPYAVEQTTEEDLADITPEGPTLIPVESTDIISLSTLSTDNTNEFYLVDSVNGALVKRADPLTTTRISNSWLNTGSTFVVVDQLTLDSLPIGEPMLPKGPAIIRFSPNGNHYYVNGADGSPRELTTSGLEVDLFGGTPFHSLTWNLPETIEDQVEKGRALVRFEINVVVEWRNFVRSL